MSLSMSPIRATRADEIQFHTLLKPINETHRRGLEADEDDA